MPEPRLNIELLKKVREKIATTPDAYDQSLWGRAARSAPCGTACCIAGWACVLAEQVSLEQVQQLGRSGDLGRDQSYRHIADVARDLLGIDEEEADTLFASDPGGEWYEEDDEEEEGSGATWYEGGGWPEDFAGAWEAADNPTARAAVAVAYLDHIIETGKVLE